MSPIGRVFLVLNLGLAGTFISFAGTYLQQADNYKQLLDELAASSKLEIDGLRSAVAGEKQKLANEQRVVGQLDTRAKGLQNQLDEKEREIQDQKRKLGEIEGSLKSTDAHLARIDSAISTATANAAAAMTRAITAEKARDDAVTAMNKAQKDYSDATFEIENLKTDVDQGNARIAVLDLSIREKDVYLGIVNARFPGILTTLHPAVSGTVSHTGVGGIMITIAIDKGGDLLKGGARFAIFSSAEGYKGEAVATEIDGSKKFCFARVTLKDGKKIIPGDLASTNLSGHGAN